MAASYLLLAARIRFRDRDQSKHQGNSKFIDSWPCIKQSPDRLVHIILRQASAEWTIITMDAMDLTGRNAMQLPGRVQPQLLKAYA